MSTETPISPAKASTNAPEALSHLGRYEILREIGRGATATVYEARDQRMGRHVALKVLDFDPLLPPERRITQIERFEREARAIARLSHPNIVSVYDVGEGDGKHFLVMELLEGVNLRERIDAGGPLALTEAVSVVEQIASALDATHREGIVHRDIKPSNVICLPDGRVKMLDFGIARRGEDATVTHTGMVIGSPAYMSPEQGRGEAASPASDIWSLGALIYEMLSGIPPFAAPHVAAVLYKAAYEEPAPLTGDAARAQRVVARAMSKRPEDRYPTAGALAHALRAALMRETGEEEATLVRAAPPSPIKLILPSTAPFLPSADATRVASGTPLTEALPRRKRRLASDIAVVSAWAALGATALGIVALRLRPNQEPMPSVAAAQPTETPAAVATAVPAALPPQATPQPPAALAVPSPTLSIPQPNVPSSAAVQVVEHTASPTPIAPRPTPAATPVATVSVATPKPAHPAPTPKATVASLPHPAPKRPKPTPHPQVVAFNKPASHGHIGQADGIPAPEPSWDSGTDTLGPPVPVEHEGRRHERDHSAQNHPRSFQPSKESGENQGHYSPRQLLGTWHGNLWTKKATLVVQQCDSESFSGTLLIQTPTGPSRLAIAGTFSPVTGRISFWGMRVLDGATGPNSSIGQESGRLIAADQMGGMGLGFGKTVFTWSFSR